ncbi:MAG TPA: M13 family metallopeptidase [Myxococcales bacterium]|jgi:predicted metalloendopeptidase
MKALPLLAACAVACASKQPAPQSTGSQPQPASQPQSATQSQSVAQPVESAQSGAAGHGGEKPGIDLAGIDRTVAPGDDFFSFANGTWVKNTEIPPDRSSYGTGGVLVELTAKRTADLIAHAPKEGDGEKIADYYAAYMDEAGIEAKGLAPLQSRLMAIARIVNKTALAKALGQTIRADVDVLNNTRVSTENIFGLWVAQDLDDPTSYSPFLLQGGLCMPDRDYYLDPSERMQGIREKYQAYIATLLDLAKQPDAQGKAARIFDLEKRIAEVHATRLETEEVTKSDNHWPRESFAKNAPGLDWRTFFDAAGLGKQKTFVVWQPKATTGIARLVNEVPLQVWKEWLTYHAISRAAPYLPKAFVDASFQFHGKTLAGTPQLRDRWKRAVSATDAALGEAVGKLYVERYFPPAEKARAEEMVKNLLLAFDRRIDALDWMSPKTKATAKAKLKALKVGVGYPDKWRDYSSLQVSRDDAYGNFERAQLFELRRNLAKLGQPVDRGEWVMNPQLVNAVNLPAMNALNFPAAILQPPYFDPERAAVMDYGAAGAIIGHEISHSFDNQGALFDDEGRLRNWWTPEDFAHFEASGKALAKQFDEYEPFPGLHVKGEQTLSENIADVAGLNAAYDAYRISLNGQAAPSEAGFSGDQLFFLSFAQSWRNKTREAALRQQIITDGHAPARYRAQTVRNLDAWYPAFNVQPGQALFLAPQERVRVW